MGRVLVIDDEPDVLLLCRVNLRHAGHEVLEARDGEHGIADAVTQSPDAIVLDLMLPSMDGYEVLRLLRKDERTSKVPILVLTAKAQIEDRKRSWELGADEFLTKPFSPEVLSEALERVLSLDDRERAARRDDALSSLEDAL
jgi:DNA-binding response OmpR family regulator